MSHDVLAAPPVVSTDLTEPTSRRSSVLLTVLTAVVGLGLATAIGVAPLADPDVWWQLRVGQYVVDTHQLTWVDPWALLADRPYVATQWLPEAIGYLTYQRLGLPGLAVLRVLAVLAFGVAVYATARLAGGRLVAAAMTSLAVFGSVGGLALRPQLVSFVLFALVVAACWRMGRDRRARWWLVPVFWLWGCSHGLWVFGLALVGLVLIALVADPRVTLRRSQVVRLGLLLLSCVAALAVTPMGPSLLTSPWGVAKVAAGVAVEWAPTPLYNVYAFTTAAMVFAVAVLWVRRPAPRPWWQVAMLVLAAAFALWMWRLVPLAAILAAPLLAAEVQTRLGTRREVFVARERVLAVGAALVAAIIGLVLAGPASSTTPGDTASVDRGLDTVPAGSVVYNDFGVSGWLLWRHPDLSPVIDLRGEIYGAADFADYSVVSQVQPGWEAALARSGAEYAIQAPDAPLTDALVRRHGWTRLARSPGYVLLRAPENTPKDPS